MYNYGRPFEFDMHYGLIVTQSMDESAENAITEGGAANYVYAGGVTIVKSLWIVFSLGTICSNDRLADRNLSGEISDGQFWAGSLTNSGVALGSLAIGGGTSSLIARGGGGLILQGAGAGFSSSLSSVLLTRGSYGALDIRYEGTITGDLVQIGTGTALGGAFGAGARLQQALRPGSNYTGTLNLLNKEEMASYDAATILPKSGEFQITAHGVSARPTTPAFAIQDSITGTSFAVGELEKMLQTSGKYAGQNITLVACNTGKGGVSSYAAQLSRRLFVAVRAPTGLLHLGNVAPIGEWTTFSPFSVYFPATFNPNWTNPTTPLSLGAAQSKMFINTGSQQPQISINNGSQPPIVLPPPQQPRAKISINSGSQQPIILQ
jgi:hypothetical protein